MPFATPSGVAFFMLPAPGEPERFCYSFYIAPLGLSGISI